MVDAITPELSTLVLRVCEALVTVVAMPLKTTWKQGRIVMIVETMTAVNISAMARVLGVVLYPDIVRKIMSIGKKEWTYSEDQLQLLRLARRSSQREPQRKPYVYLVSSLIRKPSINVCFNVR